MARIENIIIPKELLCQLYYKENLSFNEIGSKLGVSSETVRLRFIKYGYKPRDKKEASTIALRKKYGFANI